MKIAVYENTFFRYSQSPNPKGDIWLIHAFGESGKCYESAFQSPLVVDYNIWAPDLPGSGVTPRNSDSTTVESLTSTLGSLINAQSQTKQVFLVPHSVSVLMAVLLAAESDLVKGIVSVEGNLTEKDSVFSSLPTKYSQEEFYQEYTNRVYAMGESDIELRKYLSSIYFANPLSLFEWGQSTEKFVRDNKAGLDYIKAKCPKLYLWGSKFTPPETAQFIKDHQLDNFCYGDFGHWPMREIGEIFYQKILEFISKHS